MMSSVTTTPAPPPLRISCAECALEHTSACDDCVVTFLLRDEPQEAVVIDVDELRALRALNGGGLVPRLRHSPGSATA